MRKFKKLVALGLAAMMALSTAACGNSGGGDSDTSGAAESVENNVGSKGNITVSWWGGDARHEATSGAISKFMELNPDVKVTTSYGSWTGWESKMSTQFFSKSAPDMNQINWNWISSFSSDGSAFLDLNEYSDIIDLSQFDESALEQCKVGDSLQAIPIAMTGRVFYFNKTTFEKAGIDIPTSYEELKEAGQVFKDKLGEDYYPLSLGEYDRMILMVFYLESKYGKNWVEDGEVNYTQEEVQEGLDFIKSLEDDHITPTIQKITGDGAESLDKNPNWMDGHYAGIFEWDSSASKFKGALNEGEEFVVGDYFQDWGEYKGGFSKVSMAFAISSSAADPEACAKLINFLLNEEEGVKLMGSERGIPLSSTGLEICKANGLLDETVAEANAKVMEGTEFELDPQFEDSKLKSSDGTYYDVMAGVSYGDYEIDEAAEILIDEINKVLGK